VRERERERERKNEFKKEKWIKRIEITVKNNRWKRQEKIYICDFIMIYCEKR
jgi:hypothetical protein